MNQSSENVQISRLNLELFYSFLVLALIPVLMIVNTVLITRNVRSDYDYQLLARANTASSIIGTSVAPAIDDPGAVQQQIEQIAQLNEDISNITVATEIDGELMVIAATNQQEQASGAVQSVQEETQLKIAIDRGEPIALLVPRSADDAGRSWSVSAPIFADEAVIGVTSVDISLSQADNIINSTFMNSFILLAVTVVVVVLLLSNHFKFVERAQLTKNLQEADRLKSDFLSVASHELKAPMSIIKGYIANVVDGTFGEVNDAVKENLQTAMDQTSRLNNLVQDLLNVSRIEQGRISYDIQHVVLDDIIKPIAKQYESKAAEKSLKIAYEGNPNTAVLADPGRVQEIMTNLIDNAVKYSDKAGTISVKIHELDKQAEIKVKDVGIGLTAEQRDNLFQRFYRVKTDKTKNISGTGLGLWIIKQYITAMKGIITVDSLPDVGTEFTVLLPLQIKSEGID